MAMALLPTKKGLVLKVAPGGSKDDIEKVYTDFPK